MTKKKEFSYIRQLEALARIGQAVTSDLYLEDILKTDCDGYCPGNGFKDLFFDAFG